MVRAILADTKSQTRRAISPQPDSAGNGPRQTPPRADECKFGAPGDRLWVRETFYAWGRWETRRNAKKGRDEWHSVDMTLECGKAYEYPASGGQPQPMAGKRHSGVTPRWWKRPAIHMPRAASRLTLEIAVVRVERLQTCSEADAIAEGCSRNHNGYYWGGPHVAGGLKQLETAVAAYRDLWDSINGAGPHAWSANPWVWVVEFRRLEQRQ